MKRWRWVLLILELFLFALILVLPQVDLPDFAFHRGSAPIVAKAKVSSPTVLSGVTAPTNLPSPQHIAKAQTQQITPVVHSTSHSLLSLFCAFLC